MAEREGMSWERQVGASACTLLSGALELEITGFKSWLLLLLMTLDISVNFSVNQFPFRSNKGKIINRANQCRLRTLKCLAHSSVWSFLHHLLPFLFLHFYPELLRLSACTVF